MIDMMRIPTTLFLTSAILCIGIAPPCVQGQGVVALSPSDPPPAGLQSLRVVATEASSSFGDDYRAQHAVDRDSHTKWVAADEASSAAPQWITLRLATPREVTAVAVCGEALDNDGFQAGAIQVATPEGTDFHTVLEIPQAPARDWIATFPAVRTTAVRLLVTKSGGPSPHTDIYEIQLYGPPLPPHVMLAHVSAQLAAAESCLAQSQEWLAAPPHTNLVRRLGVLRHLESLNEQVDAARRRHTHWEQLSDRARTELCDTVDELVTAAVPLQASLEALERVWSSRLADIDAAQNAVADHSAIPDPQRVIGRGASIAVVLDEESGCWDATWLGSSDAALRGVQFSVEVDGERLAPRGVKAESRPFTDACGSGTELVQTWGQGVRVERRLRIYDDHPMVVVGGSIGNETDHVLSLGRAMLLDLPEGSSGWWHTGQALESPGVVTVAGDSLWTCEPAGTDAVAAGGQRSYAGTMMLALAHQKPSAALLVGFLTGREARPRVGARFRTPESGTALAAWQDYLGRQLAPGERLELDSVAVRAELDPWLALERYGDDVAASAAAPVRTTPTSLWCSWYAHRMAMTEELVLANAAVAARHFQPLGMDIIQLDHGWQRGDVTGDWVPNERFPNGLPWLAEQLRSRHALRLGLWISPTDVADVSDLFQQHADWLLRDGQGAPQVNWRWYWAPNPNCYELDASHPAAHRFLRETFSRLASEGASYFKIDFLAPCGGDHFVQHDPACTRGWGVLRRAMEAIREGAGPEAFIRYCQAPPLLAVGLADGAYGGNDLLDGGRPDVMPATREAARALAASYWVNDRLYRREVCDLSVRMQADVEEVRLRLALMALAGCSISFSDELQFLPPSRLRLMQQVLPPGMPAMRPLDLFQHSIPSVWHVHCKRPFAEWDVVGLFNLEDQPQMRSVDLTALGLKPDANAFVFEFWEERSLGIHQGRVEMELPAHASRILLVHRVSDRPQLLGTDMHLLGGYHELTELVWDEAALTLRGVCRRLPGATGRVYLYLPPGYTPRFDFPLTFDSASVTHVGQGVWMKELEFVGAEAAWTIPFERPAPANEAVANSF
ncbi:MAG: alpha-galactosidase [Pirellulaceae bacterium]